MPILITKAVQATASANGCCHKKTLNKSYGKAKWATAGALMASLGVCAAGCLLPAALIGLGVAGSFASALDSLAPYKWVFIVITTALLAYGFYLVYRKPLKDPDSATAVRFIRVALWLAAALAVSGSIYSYMEPWLTRP